jgi:aryl-alcohol dehydrogenase-like predicted oxidoreductase
MTDDGFKVVEALEEVAGARSVGASTVAIAWLLSRPAVVAPIIGANTAEQLGQLVPASELDLDESEMAALSEASASFAEQR